MLGHEAKWSRLVCVVLKRRHRERRIEYKNSALSSDQKSDCIGTMTKETQRDRSLRSEQAIRATEIERQVELRIEL